VALRRRGSSAGLLDAQVLRAGARRVGELRCDLDELRVGDDEERVALGDAEAVERHLGRRGQRAVVDWVAGSGGRLHAFSFL